MWERKPIDRQVRVRDPRIIDQDIEAGEFSADGAEQRVYRMRITDIADKGKDTNLKTQQFPAYFLQRFLVAAGDDEIAALLSEFARDSESDAAAGPSDQGCAALEMLLCFRHREATSYQPGFGSLEQHRMLIGRGLRILF